MDKLGKHLSLISFFVIGIILLVGFLKGQPFQEMLTIGVRFVTAFPCTQSYTRSTLREIISESFIAFFRH